VRWGAAWILASALLVACFRGVDWSRALAAGAGARPGWLVAAVLANAAIVVLWAAQWRLFLPRGSPVRFSRVLRITAVMAMTANSVPYFAGQLTGIHLLAKREGLGHATALSVATLDQVAEGLAKVSLIVLVALLVPLPSALAGALPLLAGAVAALLCATLIAAWRPAAVGRWGKRLTDAPGGSAPLFAAVGRFAAAWSMGLERARRPAVLPAGFALALLMKVAEATGIVAVQTSLSVELPVAATLVVLASVSLATMIPLAPANLGVYEGSAFLAYRWAGVDGESALALAVLQHLALLAAMGGSGWAAVTFRRVPHASGAPDPVAP
jgi:uncharacterized protein (TIRG00374 family)